MKTYLITESNEPLKEGCLTQFGVLKSYSKDRFFNIIGQGPEKDIWIDDLKHLKCYDISSLPKIPKEQAYGPWRDVAIKSGLEITDPSELQRIWEAKRGEEPELWELDYYDSYRAWQNFTLEPGVHEVREPASVFNSIEVSEEVKKVVDNSFKVLPDNNGWITEGLAEDILHITDDPRRDYNDDESTYKKIIEIIKSHQDLNA